MRHLDLFSGIGGFSLAASWVWGDDHDIVGFCEIDKFCQQVLHKHWPAVPIYDDITELKGSDIHGTIDLITGGFPCQPYSVAGKRKGAADDRHLWPEMFRVITETSPRWVIGENVAGIVNMELDGVLSDLEGQGYTAETFIIPACAVNAPHRRDRVWIVADTEGSCKRTGLQQGEPKEVGRSRPCNGSSTIPNAKQLRTQVSLARQFSTKPLIERQNWWAVEPDVGRMAARVPQRVDRLKSLGNAIVPQVSAVIMEAIKAVDDD